MILSLQLASSASLSLLYLFWFSSMIALLVSYSDLRESLRDCRLVSYKYILVCIYSHSCISLDSFDFSSISSRVSSMYFKCFLSRGQLLWEPLLPFDKELSSSASNAQDCSLVFFSSKALLRDSFNLLFCLCCRIFSYNSECMDLNLL